jgi:hypothetical protein
VNLRQYNISKQGGTQDDQKPGHRGATRPGFRGKSRDISSFILQPDTMGNGALINDAHVVPMVNYNSDIYNCHNLHRGINAMPYYALDGQGRGLMVTGELSGCCFCWLAQGNDLWCIHVQPQAGIDGTALQNTLRVNGRFANAPGTRLGTYGRKNYPAGRASVIGVRRAGRWRLFAQTSDDRFSTITGAYQIYPGAVRNL